MNTINGSSTIVIADDDPDDRFIAQKAFEDLGFSGSLRFARDGVELLNYMTSCATNFDHRFCTLPELILLDLNMPLKDGWESLEEIKKLPGLQDIPVIIWTTSNDDEDRLRSIEMGASDFITKPGSYKKLLDSFLCLIEKYGNNHKNHNGCSAPCNHEIQNNAR